MRILCSAALIAALLAPTAAHACPNCRDAIRDNNSPKSPAEADAASLAQGFNRSILAMIAVPVLLLGAGSIGLVRAARRGQIPPL
jgi:hypothetical protein